MLWLVIATRVLANPCSNALQKVLAGRGLGPLWVIGLTHVGLSVAVLPWLLIQPLPLASGFWWNVSLSALLATVANTLIVVAVHRADLSLVGPVNSFKPVVSLLPGWLLLGERPTVAGAAGIALVIGGSCLLNPPQPGSGSRSFERLFRDRGVQIRLAALVPSAVEAVFLKRALAHGDALAVFAWWSVLCVPGVLVALLLTRGFRHGTRQLALAQSAWLPTTGLILTTGLMQSCTVVTLAWMQVGYSLALFQISSVVLVLIGWGWFGERDFARRLGGSLVMAAGAAVIVTAR